MQLLRTSHLCRSLYHRTIYSMERATVLNLKGVAGKELQQLYEEKVVPALQQDGVIAVPTDTIYGLATRAQSTAGVAQLYAIKGRNEQKPVAICVESVDQISTYAHSDVVKEEMLRELLPGPVTVVLQRTEELNKDLNPHTSLIGIRVPDHEGIKALVKACGEPLALTSANRSSEPSTKAVGEFKPLWPQLACVLDGGEIQSSDRAGSTVVDISKPGKYLILRPGTAFDLVTTVLHKYGLSADS